MKKIGVIGWVLIAVGVIAVPTIIIIISKRKQSNIATQQALAASNLAVPTAPVCIPFTQAQQNAQKEQARARCAAKLLIPFVGQVQYYACMKSIDSNLTPVTNC